MLTLPISRYDWRMEWDSPRSKLLLVRKNSTKNQNRAPRMVHGWSIVASGCTQLSTQTPIRRRVKNHQHWRIRARKSRRREKLTVERKPFPSDPNLLILFGNLSPTGFWYWWKNVGQKLIVYLKHNVCDQRRKSAKLLRITPSCAWQTIWSLC